MSTATAAGSLPEITPSHHSVSQEARRGLTQPQKSLAPWLFYDEAGSELFERITELPEYYLTRTERALFLTHAAEIFAELGLSVSPAELGGQAKDAPAAGPQFENAAIAPGPHVIPFPRSLTVVELGAGTASKTGVLLAVLARLQREVLYQPVDISPSALAAACAQLENSIPGLSVRPHVANYTTQRFPIARPAHSRVLALYIGSSIGNFSPSEARDILQRLRAQLSPGDALLLGVDLAPCLAGTDPPKEIATLLAAYNDAAGVTAAFNRNLLVRANRELDADFDLDGFTHRAVYDAQRGRVEMHLVSRRRQEVRLAGRTFRFAAGEIIHTESSYKYTVDGFRALAAEAGWRAKAVWLDAGSLFSVHALTYAAG